MSTGYSTDRARPHETFLSEVQRALYERGYDPVVLAPDGDNPDMSIDGGCAYVDAKTRAIGHENYAVKHGALCTYLRLTAAGTPVYVVWQNWRVDSVLTLLPRIASGPRRPTGNGSMTDWVLVRPGGTPFDEFFLSLYPRSDSLPW